MKRTRRIVERSAASLFSTPPRKSNSASITSPYASGGFPPASLTSASEFLTPPTKQEQLRSQILGQHSFAASKTSPSHLTTGASPEPIPFATTPRRYTNAFPSSIPCPTTIIGEEEGCSQQDLQSLSSSRSSTSTATAASEAAASSAPSEQLFFSEAGRGRALEQQLLAASEFALESDAVEEESTTPLTRAATLTPQEVNNSTGNLEPPSQSQRGDGSVAAAEEGAQASPHSAAGLAQRHFFTNCPLPATRPIQISHDAFHGSVHVSGFFLSVDPNVCYKASREKMNPNVQLTINDDAGNFTRVRYNCVLKCSGGLKIEALLRFQCGWISKGISLPKVPEKLSLGKGYDIGIPFLFHFTCVNILNDNGENSGAKLYFSGTPLFGVSCGYSTIEGGHLTLNHSKDVHPQNQTNRFVGLPSVPVLSRLSASCAAKSRSALHSVNKTFRGYRCAKEDVSPQAAGGEEGVGGGESEASKRSRSKIHFRQLGFLGYKACMWMLCGCACMPYFDVIRNQWCLLLDHYCPAPVRPAVDMAQKLIMH